MSPAVAVKVAESKPAGTVTEGGTLRPPALLDSVTVAPPGPATFDRMTVHAEVPPDERPVGAQSSRVGTTGATRDREAVWVPPLKVATTVAVWSVAMVPAVAVKLACKEPGGTIAVKGTVRAATLLDSDTVAPPTPAAFDRLTVQLEELLGDRLVGVQLKEVRIVGATSERENV